MDHYKVRQKTDETVREKWDPKLITPNFTKDYLPFSENKTLKL